MAKSCVDEIIRSTVESCVRRSFIIVGNFLRKEDLSKKEGTMGRVIPIGKAQKTMG